MKKPSMKSRHHARRAALQALYQWDHTHQNNEELIKHFIADPDVRKIDRHFFREIVSGAITHMATIDNHIQPLLDRPMSQLNPVELAVLRLAVFELAFCLATPYRVVINEALEISKEFGSEEGHRYVNAVLDKAAKLLRETEFNQKSN